MQGALACARRSRSSSANHSLRYLDVKASFQGYPIGKACSGVRRKLCMASIEMAQVACLPLILPPPVTHSFTPGPCRLLFTLALARLGLSSREHWQSAFCLSERHTFCHVQSTQNSSRIQSRALMDSRSSDAGGESRLPRNLDQRSTPQKRTMR